MISSHFNSLNMIIYWLLFVLGDSVNYAYVGNNKFIALFKRGLYLSQMKTFCEAKPNGEMFMPKNLMEITAYQQILKQNYPNNYENGE